MSFNFFKRKKDNNEVEPKKEKVETTSIRIMYSYKEVSNDCKNPLCLKLLELDRLYTRVDIESISARLGYSVWHRRGGEGCTHEWKTETIIAKTET